MQCNSRWMWYNHDSGFETCSTKNNKNMQIKLSKNVVETKVTQ